MWSMQTGRLLEVSLMFTQQSLVFPLVEAGRLQKREFIDVNQGKSSEENNDC